MRELLIISHIGGGSRGPTLWGQHGSGCLMEVQQLLQEQDGLQERRVNVRLLIKVAWCYLFWRSRTNIWSEQRVNEAYVLRSREVRESLRCWWARGPSHPSACCTLYQDHSGVTQTTTQPTVTNNQWTVVAKMWACCLDAVCELLQSFGSDRFHGGDERGQLVLGAGRCSLQTNTSSVFMWDDLSPQRMRTRRRSRPAESSQTRTCSSSGVWEWGRWWGQPSSRGA